MPNHLRNWTFEDVAGFLEQNFFTLRNIEGSHHYFVGLVDGVDRLCHIQRHNHDSIPPKTLKINVIEKSGIPLELWTKWSQAGSSRKKIIYPGAIKKVFSNSTEEYAMKFEQTKGPRIQI